MWVQNTLYYFFRPYFIENKKCLFFTDNRGKIRYSIYCGDPDGQFKIDPLSGTIRTASSLDHETRPQFLLNIQATSGEPPVYGQTQVSKNDDWRYKFGSCQ